MKQLSSLILCKDCQFQKIAIKKGLTKLIFHICFLFKNSTCTKTGVVARARRTGKKCFWYVKNVKNNVWWGATGILREKEKQIRTPCTSHYCFSMLLFWPNCLEVDCHFLFVGCLDIHVMEAKGQRFYAASHISLQITSNLYCIWLERELYVNDITDRLFSAKFIKYSYN